MAHGHVPKHANSTVDSMGIGFMVWSQQYSSLGLGDGDTHVGFPWYGRLRGGGPIPEEQPAGDDSATSWTAVGSAAMVGQRLCSALRLLVGCVLNTRSISTKIRRMRRQPSGLSTAESIIIIVSFVIEVLVLVLVWYMCCGGKGWKVKNQEH